MARAFPQNSNVRAEGLRTLAAYSESLIYNVHVLDISLIILYLKL